MSYVEHETEHESESKPVVLQKFGSEFVPIVSAQGGARKGFSISLCLPDSETKLKIIPNRKLTVKDVIKDTNNRYKELIQRVK